MAISPEIRIALERAAMAVLGGVAGLALWALGEVWTLWAMPPWLYLALFTFTVVYTVVVLALTGPLRLRHALVGALGLAVPMTGLSLLAAQREVTASNVLDDPVLLSVASVLMLVAIPFLSVWLRDRRAWLSYAPLFDTAWTIVVRYGAAAVFVAVFWMIAFMSDSLLDLVGISVIDQIMRIGWARFFLTGMVFGLGLAVVYELRAMISPFLILRLLRLLVPVVLPVVAVFVIAVPLRGLSGLFGGVSAAAILMGTAILAVILMNAAVDKSDAEAVSTPGIRWATRMLALLLPVLSALAIWAVALRVRQYGWTPDRVLAIGASGFMLAYGLGYAWAVRVRPGWMNRIRRVNVRMALAVIMVSALWLTPVLNADRIAVASQVLRYSEGRSDLSALSLWPMAHDWGKAGQAGLAQLEARTDLPDHADLVARIAVVRAAPDPFHFEQAVNRRTAPERAAQLARMLELRPDGGRLDPGALAGVPSYRLDQWLDGCARKLPDGRAGCVLVTGLFSPLRGSSEQGILLFLDGSGRAAASFLALSRDPQRNSEVTVRDVFDPVAGGWPVLPEQTVAQALDETFEIRPTDARALFIGDVVLIPAN